MRSFVGLLLIVNAACASSGSKPNTEIMTPSERIVASDNQAVIRTTVPPNARATVPVPQARAFAVIKAVYEELGIPVVTYDQASSRIGNNNFWKTHKLGTTNLSVYLNCGESLTGTIADNYRVYLSIISAVRPDGSNSSEIETALSAYAVNMEGTAGDRIPCGTNGRLEDRIQKGVRDKAGSP